MDFRHIAIPSHDKGTCEAAQDWHAGVGDRINAIYGGNLAGLGERLASHHAFGSRPEYQDQIGESSMRQPRSSTEEGFIDQAMLEAAADVIVWQGTKSRDPV